MSLFIKKFHVITMYYNQIVSYICIVIGDKNILNEVNYEEAIILIRCRAVGASHV